MNTRAAGVLGVCIIVAALVSSWLSGSASAGRYQLVRVENSCLLLDTKTGRVWARFFPSNSGPSIWEEATGPWAR
jgi:hypothetical protein